MKRRGQEGFAGRHAESLIPLILILILAVFIAGKFGLVNLNSLPVIGSLFPAPYIKVVVFGHASQAMDTLLKSEDYRIAGITYLGSLPINVVYPNQLNNYDIIILQGQKVCDRTARKAIADRVKGGAKLIVVGNACTEVSDDRNAIGWDVGIGSLGDVMPVKYGKVQLHEIVGPDSVFADGKFKIIAQDHPMFNSIINFGFYGSLTNIFPTNTGNVLAYVDTYLGKQTSPSTFAIVESQGLFGGKTIYFAFDPSTTSRNMFMNTLLYVKGAKG